MSRASDLESYRSSAISASLSGDYETAIKYAMAAKLTLSAMPDVKSGPEAGTTWDRGAIDSFIADCRRQLSASSGLGASGGMIQFQEVTYANESC